jgi:ribosomal protein L10
MDVESIKKISQLPSKEEMLAKMLGSLNRSDRKLWRM